MPVPASNDEFLDLVRKSGVIDDARLDAYLKQLADSGLAVSDQPSKFASRLVRDGVLTFFQAEQILQGKYKRFSIGKYKVLEKLGVGGMGQVFLCEHKMMKRRVAVKVLPVTKADDDAARDRFQREGQVAAALDHPNVVRAFDIDQDADLHFLVMEYVEGINFHDLVKKHGVLDVLRACHYIYGAAAGLEYARGMGIVHRDIKPGNILVDRGGVVKILDMGLARFFKDEEDHLTRKYDENVLGTADYLAPEQALDSHSVDTRADIYSLGGTFYYLLTGSAPFPDGSVAQKLLAHQVKEPKPIQEIRPEVPTEVVEIVAKMMAKNADDRYATPADLMQALLPLVQTPIPPPAEKEMPNLSRAAGGGMASMVRPTSSVGMMPSAIALSQSSSGIPIMSFAAGSGAGTNVAATSAVIQAPGVPAIWEDIATDTNAGGGAATEPERAATPKPLSKPKVKPDTKRPTKTPVPVEAEVAPPTSRRKLFIAAGAAAVILIGGAFAMLSGGKGGGSGSAGGGGPVPVTGPRTLYVSKSSISQTEHVTFKTLSLAIKAANPGDTILLVDDPHEEQPLRITAATPGKLKDVTIDAGTPTKSVTLRLPAGALQGKDRGFFEINGADGLKIRNLTLAVNDRLDYGVSITGPVDGLTLENVTLQQPHSAGVFLDRTYGTPDRPIRLERCGIVSPNANCDGVQISKPTSKAAVNHVAITNCRFFGQGWNALHCYGPVSNVEFRNNRVFSFNCGVRLDGPDSSYQVKVLSNTFHTMTEAAILLGANPAETPKPELVLELNHFAKCREILHGTGNPAKFPGLKLANNSRDKDSKNGNVDPKAAEMAFTVPAPITDDPATFLKVDDDKLTVVVDGKKTKTGARD